MDDIREHSFDHRVRFDECAADDRLRAGGYLRLMQDLAWRHSERLGMDRAWYHASHLAWLVRYADLRIVGDAGSGDTVRLTTRVTGWRRVLVRRETIGTVGGAEVARADIDWVLVDAAGRPARVPDEVIGRYSETLPTFQPGRLALPDAPRGATDWPWQVGIRDLDPLRHVNNATYLDILDAALAGVTGAEAGPPPPVRYEVEYLRPALARHAVTVTHWTVAGTTSARFAEPGDEDLVRARVQVG